VFRRNKRSGRYQTLVFFLKYFVPFVVPEVESERYIYKRPIFQPRIENRLDFQKKCRSANNFTFEAIGLIEVVKNESIF